MRDSTRVRKTAAGPSKAKANIVHDNLFVIFQRHHYSIAETRCKCAQSVFSLVNFHESTSRLN